MSSGEKHRCLHAVFSGRVQGVGFRYTVCELAASRQVTGFVKNLWDGTVELKAEGPLQELHALLQAIRASRLRRYIVKDQIQWLEAGGKYKGFGIEF
ncbi:acylphosphatase [Pontiella sp.]|uniref:acylphosphatase n=1 Tax=Pontiella sp. TaxID=2837462 RepID=UPI0035626960